MSVVVKAAGKKQSTPGSGKGKGTTTIVVNTQKRAAKAKPQPRKNLVKRQIAKMKRISKARRILCPSYNAIDAFNFPVTFRVTKGVAASSTVIGVFAPYNDILGYIYQQGMSPPDALAPVSSVTVSDPFIFDLLTPTSTSGAANASMARWTEFCIEIMVTDALGTVNNTIQLVRWQQGGVGLIGSGNAPEFYSTWNAIGEHPRLIEEPSAYFVGTKCFHTGMQDRSALEFTPLVNGTPSYNAVYGSTLGTSNIGANLPWSPIMFALTSPAGSSCTIRVIVKGNIQVSVAPNKFLSRLQKPLPSGSADAENKWWKEQHMLKTMPLVSPQERQSGKGRSVQGFVGMQP